MPSRSGALRVSAAAVVDAPTNLVGNVVNPADIFLSWATSRTFPVTYMVEAGSGPGLTNLASVSSGTAPRFQASNVPQGTYYIRVRAVDASGAVSAPSNEVVITIGSCLGATGLLATLNSGATVTLRWNAGNGVVSYVLEAGTAPGLSNIASVPVGTTTSFTASGVPNGSYYVRVRTNSTCGTAPVSNEVTLNVDGVIRR